MKVFWPHAPCVICLEDTPLTDEHLIPTSLGGLLEARILCKACNSGFGSGFEARARLAPELRRAASSTEADLQELTDRLEKGASYSSTFGDQTIEQKIGKDLRFGTAKLPDGSFITPEEETPKLIAAMLRKKGASSNQIQQALTSWEAAAPDEILSVHEELYIRKWPNHPASPTYAEPPLSPLLPLKIAYEFAALIIGDAIYQSCTGLNIVRRILMDQDEASAEKLVIRHIAQKASDLHGIAFEGNKPFATFQIRLFGILAYRVHLPNLGIGHPTIIYSHRISTGEEGGKVIT